MEYKKYENDTYNLYTIKTDKFRNCRIEVIFRDKCTKESITNLDLLFDILMESNEMYKTHKLFARRKQDLYNLRLYAVNSRVGAMQISNVIAEFLDPKYMEEDVLESIIETLFDTIFRPNVTGGAFDEDTFDLIKKRLINEIDSIKENPKQQSLLNALNELDASSPKAYYSCGYKDIIEDMTPKKLYDYYKKVLENSYVDVYVIGNLDMDNVNNLIKKYAKFNTIKTSELDLYLDECVCKKKKSVDGKSNTSQMQLVNIYTLNHLSEYETNTVMPIFNMIFGSGSLDSKLYKLLRGENSLCYNLASYNQKYDRVLIVYTAIDKENSSMALNLCKRGLDDMIKGNISESELENAKRIMVTSLNMTYDSPSRLIDNYLFSNIANLKSIDERIDEYKKVSVYDLVKVAKKINLALTYRMGNF